MSLTPQPQRSGALRTGDRLAAVQRARHRLLDEGPGASLQGVEPWIASSWQRCLSGGMKPDQRVVFAPNALQAQRRVQDEHHELLNAARPSMETLGGLVSGIGFFALLTDARGTVIDVAGQVDRSDREAATIAQVGVDLSEASAGTSAICTALRERHPVWLHQSEHYFDATGVYSCAGAPLFGPRGECIGMLDLTGIRVGEQRQLIHIVSQYAHEIERSIVLRQPMALMLRISWPGSGRTDAGRQVGLIAVDEDGFIVGVDHLAREMIPDLDQLEAQELHLSDVFASRWQALFDQAASEHTTADLPLWSGLSLQVEALASRNMPAPHAPLSRPAQASEPARPATFLKTIQAALIQQALRDARGNVGLAAQRLGISRATLYRKLQSKQEP